MNPQHTLPSLTPMESLEAAERLRRELSRLGIPGDVHDGYGLALVSVWVGLAVWCDQDRYWWRTGWDQRRKRAVYAWHPVLDPARTARRVAFRYADLRQAHPLPEITSLLAPAPETSPERAP